MRAKWRLPLGLVALLVLVACSSSNESGNQAATNTTRPPRHELRVGFISGFQYVTEGPGANVGMEPLNANVAETLTTLSPTYELKPWLAERWEFVSPNTWRFFLKPGVRFQDGQPFNANAVKSGLFDRWAANSGGQINAGPNSAKVIDDLTIEYTPTVTNLSVPEQLAHPTYGVMAPGADVGHKPVGTGPFRFVELVPNDRIVVERNPDYWGPKAKVDRIVFRFFSDSATRRLALEAGDIDVDFDVNRADVKTMRAKGFNVVPSTVGVYEVMYANIKGKPPWDLLNDVQVRKAVSLAIDRRKLVDGVLDGFASPDQTWVFPDMLGRYGSLVKGFPYDPAMARNLLDAAGWKPGGDGIRQKDGRRLELTMVSGLPSADAHEPIPAYLQSQLKDVGMDLKITKTVDSPSYQASLRTGEANLWLEQGNQNDANVGFFPFFVYTGPGSRPTPRTDLAGPGGRFDDLLASSRTEVDLDKVRNLVGQAMHQLVDEDVAVIPLGGLFRIYGMEKTVTGFVPHPSFLQLRWDTVA
ncbi:MAG: ABC transporter substrate-binding protein [Actinomycetota bacterium]|nr:ABC transporter substrate-binding protein [Actinomycetota bacterium]